MKRFILLMLLSPFFLLGATGFAAEEMKSHDMQMHQSSQKEKVIRETDIEGYHFSYHLIDMQGMNHPMQEMSTHHMMVYVLSADGKAVTSADVGFLIVGPDGSEQKLMAMGMGDGFGANINLSKPGEYTIKCKFVAGEKKLIDEFKYKRD